MRVGAQAARGHHRVAELQHVVAQHGAAADRALRAPDRDAALEAEDQTPVPERVVGIGRIRLVGRRQHRDAVDEAIDGAALPADDVGHRLPVERRRRRDVGRQRTGRARRQRQEGAGGVAVLVLEARVARAVLAPADDRRRGRRIAAPVARVVAARVLLRDAECRSRSWLSMIGWPRPARAVVQTKGCCCGPEKIGPLSGVVGDGELGVRAASSAADFSSSRLSPSTKPVTTPTRSPLALAGADR